MDLICDCAHKVTDNSPAYFQETSEDHHEEQYKIQTVIFEPSAVNSISKKVLKIRNDSKDGDTFVVTRDPNSNPIYYVFDIKLENPIVRRGHYLECVITYHPQVPNQHYMDYFKISSNAFNSYRICVKGDCIGPSVNASTNSLLFYKTKNGKCLSNTFELTNMSDQQIFFQFDANENIEDQEIFKIDNIRGCLSGREYTYVTVKFVPTASRVYVVDLPPIMIQLFGIITPTLNMDPHDVGLKYFSDTYPTQGYAAYMYDCINKAIQKPPFSMSVTYLDFGTVEFDENDKNSQSLVTSLTNHLDRAIEVMWMNDNDAIFSITPKIVTIPPNESIMYECSFKPNHFDVIFSKLVTGCVYWSTETEEIHVPLNVTLKLLGNSFSANKIWLPLAEITPNVVIMPPTIPTAQCYTTTILRSSSHLPTSFKFLPPKKSNFVMKPMEGILYDFEVIVVQLHPHSSNKRAYIERWGLELNGRKDDCAPLFLKGYAEDISVVVGDGNVVSFNTVHPGSQDILTIMLKNPTIHCLRYDFKYCGTTCFSIDHPDGELVSNETVYLQWCYNGNLSTPYKTKIACKLQRLKDLNIVIDLPSIIPITIYTRCAYTELCATPNIWDFDQVEMGSTVSTSFHLFNYGLAPIHFQLLQKKSKLPTSEVTLVPTKGTVNPNDKMQILVSVQGTVTGVQETQIVYKVRLNKFSDTIVNVSEERNVLFIRLFCVYPTVQIDDIMSHNFGFLFSKRTLWGMFNINELNNTLKTIQTNETKSVEIYTPDYELSLICFHTSFAICNITNFPMKIKLKRKKNCDCKIVEKSKGMSIREYAYDCIHRKMVEVRLENELMEANSTYKMELDVSYLANEFAKIVYVMHLSYNRTIFININVSVLPEVVTMPSKYFNSFNFHLMSTFIGLMDPPSQVFPLYNNSKFIVEYEVDTVPLSRINFNYKFDIFTCINPKGTLPPFTSRNVLFKFQPITEEEYEVIVPIKLGESEFFIHMRGEGIMEFAKYPSIDNYEPKVSHYNFKNPVELSCDHLVVDPMSIWSVSDRMIFITNQTPDRIIGYSFLKCMEEGVIAAEALQRKGVLQPKESRSIVIRIQSFDQPCILNLQMVCKLLDHSEHIRHVESVHEFEKKQKELEGQFTITENGIYIPKNEVKVLPEVEHFFVTLSLNICILSIRDRDICFTTEEQFAQPPQSRLYIDSGTIFVNYATSLLSKESNETLANIFKFTPLKHNLDDSNIQFVKFVVECLLADTMLSKMFNELIWFDNHVNQPYYMQYIIAEELNKPHTKKSVLKAKHKKGLKRHLELVKSYLQAPQGPVLQSVFVQLLLDSIHNIFELGPTKQEANIKEYIYHTAKKKL